MASAGSRSQCPPPTENVVAAALERPDAEIEDRPALLPPPSPRSWRPRPMSRRPEEKPPRRRSPMRPANAPTYTPLKSDHAAATHLRGLDRHLHPPQV